MSSLLAATDIDRLRDASSDASADGDSGFWSRSGVAAEAVAFAVHDAKNLVGVLRNNIEYLHGALREDARPDVAEAVADMAECVVRLETLLREALRAARGDRNRLALAPVHLGTLAGCAADQVRRRAALRDVEVEVLADDDAVTMLDRALVLRLLDNLLDNALRHAPSGGRVVVACAAPGDRVLLSVSDDGPGIQRGDAERIFEPFVTGAPDADRGANAGLGLAFCRAVARMHGGSIAVRKSEAGGAEFLVSLPRVDPPPRASTTPRTEG